MIGVFDSGAGGLAVVKEIRKTQKDADICFFADIENAPYGTKSKRSLISLVKRDIKLLRDAGADRIVIGCCTASTVYPYLTKNEREMTVPIIECTAKDATRATKNGKIGVIGTERTIASGAFRNSISRHFSVHEMATQIFVTLVESGLDDDTVSWREFDLIYRELKPLKSENPDTLILGCTHFAYLEKTIGECLGRVKIISSPRSCAKYLSATFEKENGHGRTLFL